jgi:hypothetical protein
MSCLVTIFIWRFHHLSHMCFSPLKQMAQTRLGARILLPAVAAEIARAGGMRHRSRSRTLWRQAGSLANGGVAYERVRGLLIKRCGTLKGVALLERCKRPLCLWAHFDMEGQVFDHIVVGAGWVGSVLANARNGIRLSAAGRNGAGRAKADPAADGEKGSFRWRLSPDRSVPGRELCCARGAGKLWRHLAHPPLSRHPLRQRPLDLRLRFKPWTGAPIATRMRSRAIPPARRPGRNLDPTKTVPINRQVIWHTIPCLGQPRQAQPALLIQSKDRSISRLRAIAN